MNDFPEVNPSPDSSFALPPDSVAYFADTPEKRSRLTTFFRFLTVIPPAIWLMLYGIAAFFATIFAWFALVFTAKFPEGLYAFLADYHRYYAKVELYAFLITDKFPGFSGSADEPYESHLLLGPPKDKYSRAKTFFRGILYIPFAIVAYVLTLVAEVIALIAWFAIVITGKQPQGLQGVLTFSLGFVIRANVWYGLLTEEWPKFSDDEVTRSLQEKGYPGTIPPTGAAAAQAAPDAGFQPPTPPMPPTPPAPPMPPTPPAAP